jgi:2,4-dienoyl-CoA reductase-like NADH-dependent reductase (Old Yellow Enzyme family)
VVDIIKETRKAIPAPFAIGMKLNSVDHQDTSDMEATLSQIRLIVEAGIDFLEISGGTYEDPKVRVSLLLRSRGKPYPPS